MQTVSEHSTETRFIPTLIEKTRQGFFVYAYCPICDKAEKSKESEHNSRQATESSIAKIRAHMKVNHCIATA